MILNILLTAHIIVSLGTLLIAMLPIFNINRFNKLFMPGYAGVATSGIGLVATTNHSLPAACVRFLGVMFVVLLFRVVVLYSTEQKN